MAIVQVTSRELRNKQGVIFDLVDRGETVIIRRGKKRAYILTPIDDEDYSISPELGKKIEWAREQYKAGNVTVCKTAQELIDYLNAL